MDRLCSLVEQVLVSNREIHNRLGAMKSPSDCRYSASIHIGSRYTGNRASITSWTSVNDTQQEILSSTSLSQSAFEEELDISRVYRRARRNGSQLSLISSADQPTASAILSRFSLGEISVIAVLDLPLYSADIFNSQLYEFGDSPEYDMIYENEDDRFTGNEFDIIQTAISRQSSTPSCEPVQSSLRNLSQVGLLWKPTLKSSRGVFGTPLHKSIKYASLAISLTDKRGSLAVKGHIPIVVDRLCTFLKLKGMCGRLMGSLGSRCL